MQSKHRPWKVKWSGYLCLFLCILTFNYIFLKPDENKRNMGGDRFVVPNWKKYGPAAENVPILQEYQAKLAKKGLKDPWIRNEAWRYMPENDILKISTKLNRTIFRNVPYALGAAVIFAGIKYAMTPSGDHH